jgi:hypothetical protein
MGGRGASSSAGGGKYAGRYSGGTASMLNSAEEQLQEYIDREQRIVDNKQAYYKAIPKAEADEFIKGHADTLKELKLQQKELQAEKKRRSKNTVAQNDMADRIRQNARKNGVITDLAFSKQKSGNVKFTYTNTMTNTKNNVGWIDKDGNVSYEKRK